MALDAHAQPTSFFSAVIRSLRQERDLSQGEFARLCGVTQPAVVRWERGSDIAETTLRKVSAALGMPLEALLYPQVSRGYREFQKRRRKRKERGHASRAS